MLGSARRMPRARGAATALILLTAAGAVRPSWHRQEAGRMVQAAVRQSWIATGVSIAAALAITVWLTQSIVPALRKVVTVAQAIADGRLDNAVQVGGTRPARCWARSPSCNRASRRRSRASAP